MKKSLIRLTSFILLVLIIVSLVACADNGSGETPGTSASAVGAESTPAAVDGETTAVNAENILGPRDFGGETLTFFARSYDGAWTSDLIVEEEDGTVLNNAIYKRNARLSSLYSVNIEQQESGKRDCLTDVETRLDSGDTSFQALYLGLSDAAKAAMHGYLHDMNDLENINLEGEWWTQSSNAAWSIGDAQYFATGAITTTDDMAVRTMFFNKDIINRLNLKSVYDLVYDNEWVFDNFFEYVELAKEDNGDGVMTKDDVFGACAQSTFGFMMTMGSGEMLAGKDDENYPIIAVTNESLRFIDVVTYLSEKISGNQGIYLGDDEDIREIFGNGRSLFYAEVLLHAQTMRVNYDLSFGIVPMPKYNAEQEDYYQYSTGRNTTVVCFPALTKGDALDMATFMVEAMAIESVESVTPAYYDICLKGRYADDAESAAMLDIITTSVATDLVEVFAWGGFHSTVQNAISSGAPISSILRKSSSAAQKVMEKDVEAFKSLE